MSSLELQVPVISHSRPWITAEDRAVVADVLAEGMLASGSRRAEFEALLAERLGSAAVVAVSSGTAALVLALKSVGVGADDEVILPTYVCGSVADAVRAVGATPQLCDVSDGWLMTAQDVSARLTPRTRAVVVVHLFGIRVDTRPFMALGVPVIEDSCQAFGAPLLPDTPRGALEVFSFHATKCLTTGEGGAVAAYAEPWTSRLMDHAAQKTVPAPLSDLQAALGLSQLRRYDEFLRTRREHAAAFFAGLPAALTEDLAARADTSMFFRFPLRLPDAAASFEDARTFFSAAGVAVRRGVDRLLHRDAGLPDSAFPGAVACYRRTLSIPLWPDLPEPDRERIIRRVHEYVGY